MFSLYITRKTWMWIKYGFNFLHWFFGFFDAPTNNRLQCFLFTFLATKRRKNSQSLYIQHFIWPTIFFKEFWSTEILSTLKLLNLFWKIVLLFYKSTRTQKKNLGSRQALWCILWCIVGKKTFSTFCLCDGQQGSDSFFWFDLRFITLWFRLVGGFTLFFFFVAKGR